MPILPPSLDDRRFDDLVDDLIARIPAHTPEWTNPRLGDPGRTLIELFAWMTEMTIYRLNRVPDKLHVALLDLLGIRLDGPTAARTDVRFRLASPPEEPVEPPSTLVAFCLHYTKGAWPWLAPSEKTLPMTTTFLPMSVVFRQPRTMNSSNKPTIIDASPKSLSELSPSRTICATSCL